MKKVLILLSLIAIIIITIIACNTTKAKSILQKPGDVTPDEYTININRDTTLVTKNGALLKIPQGTLSSDQSTVTLEIKEAYSLEQMIKTGLTTQAGDEPLSSGGMIYINAKGGQNVKIKQAIKVALPADYLNPEMKLYKGQTTDDGSINWTNPATLPENKQLTAIEKGKQLFETKCSGCHAIGKDMTGPDMAHILKRFEYGSEGSGSYFSHGYNPNEEFFGLYSNVKDSAGKSSKHYDQEFLSYHGDNYNVYKCNLIKMFGGNIGPQFLDEGKSDSGKTESLLHLYQYIQNESDKRNLPLPAHHYLLGCEDSCVAYNERIFDLNNQKRLSQKSKNELINENGKLTKEIRDTNPTPAPPEPRTNTPPPPPSPPLNFDEVVSPENNEAVYYQFSIETFGWYNVDVLLKDVTGNQESELTVRITGTYREKLDIFLIIPEQKIYTKAGKKKSGTDEYVFAYTNGKIFLPQNAKAYILGMAESKSSIAFSLVQFTTGLKQNIEMELTSSTKEVFNEAITSINGKDINISVKDSKNAATIRKTEATLGEIDKALKDAEKLKPKNCDCDCGYPQKDTIKINETSK
jgi:hypothetical protein